MTRPTTGWHDAHDDSADSQTDGGTSSLPGYSVVTPARDEADNLPRLARSLAAQSHAPTRWVIVENGSGDETARVAQSLAAMHPWIDVLSVPGTPNPVRGAPIVRSLHAGFDRLRPFSEIVATVDADVSFGPDFFAVIAERFGADSDLGIASGTCFEQRGGEWRQRFVTGSTVWGATRVYRSRCLVDVLPLEERIGWDGLDEWKANALGWRTQTFLDVPFFHHRAEAERDGPSWRSCVAQGRASHYAGYRPWYLVLRALFQMCRDPSAAGLVVGYCDAAARGEPRCTDSRVRTYVRAQQHPRHLLRRAREATGRAR